MKKNAILVLAALFMNSAAVAQEMVAPISIEPYKVGVDDVLDIGVIKPEVIAYTVTVAPDGAINFPYIGSVQAEGLTLPKIQAELQTRLAEYMEFPIVSVALRENRSKKFVIYGQVAHPGAFPVAERMTVLHAITVAGGLIESSSTGNVKLLRPKPDKTGKPDIIELDINAIFKGEHENLFVLPGDTLTVQVDKFFVSGHVARPGAYPVEENMTVLHAITVAGGFVESNSTGKIKLLRKKVKNGTPKIININIEDILKGSSQNVTILPGDAMVVTVDKFFISGPVVRPGSYPVDESMTLLQAITVAGGFADSNIEGKVTLLRQKPESPEFGVVESPSLKTVLSGATNNITVEPGDTIVVSTDKFFVYGEVQRPGIYPLEPTTTPLKAISMAGGLAKFGKSSKVKILRKSGNSGKVEEIDANLTGALSASAEGEVLLKADDVVVVSEGIF